MCEGGYEPVGNRGTYGTRSKVVENSHRPANPTLDGKTRTLNEDDDDDDDDIERVENEEFVKKVYLSSVEGMTRRGRPLGRWEDKVKEYVSERCVRGNELEWARRECIARERWRFICRGHPLGGCCWREQGVGATD